MEDITSYFEAQIPYLLEYDDMAIYWYLLISNIPLWDLLTLLWSLPQDIIVDYKARVLAKCNTDPSISFITAVSFIFDAYFAVDITNDENFAFTLDQHVAVNSKTAVNTAQLTTTQWKPAADFKMFSWHWGIPLN